MALHILPCLQRINPHAVLQNDNARPHRTNIVTDFLRQGDVARID